MENATKLGKTRYRPDENESEIDFKLGKLGNSPAKVRETGDDGLEKKTG